MKRTKNIQFNGFGFPLMLKNVPVKDIAGYEALDVNMIALERAVAFWTALYPYRLTGNQIRFLRRYLKMTLEDFAAVFDCTRQAAMKWEKAGDRHPNMKWPMEKEIRLYVLSRGKVKPTKFKRAYEVLEEKPQEDGVCKSFDSSWDEQRVLEECLA